MSDWIAFWNSEHSIYVNARHRDVHYRAIADNIMRYVPGPTATVMDYGCGEALHAGRIAAAAGRVILVDAADNVRAGLAERFKQVANIEVRAPDEIRRKTKPIPKMRQENIHIFSGGHASEQDDFAIRRQFFRQLLHVPLEWPSITGIVLVDLHCGEVAQVLDPDR